MMKRYLLYVLLGLAVLPAFGQGVTDYYRVPEKSQQYNRLLTRYGGPQIRDRWYVALDGFVRTDRAQLDNSINGLVESDLVGKPGWGVLLGWTYRERWVVEGGYARMPIHTQLAISNTSPPLSLRATNDRSAFILRGKRLLLSTSKPWLRSGFWVSGGMWAVPNSSQEENRVSVAGYRYQGRWETPEYFHLTSESHNSSQMTALAELGVEYNVRLSNAIDLGISARKLWGLSNAVTTNVTYTANRMPSEQAQLQGAGTGMSYGLTLRYTYATRRHQSNVLELQGKSRLGKN
ncbi:hypothetical protein GO755_29970 [Spirosoma sp. HMF4905]|uniref:Outer membrane beta-barrel protein n=1 Tax=Spirosoma arboris TaxID=2682092 RepID=A0A7K1SL50_9BACT|nr:hypothetical protein [Spirosoma arboris]MVM34296.1 hypothetical protein [Spirosoma arboris]